MSPGTTIRSVIPRTPECNTSSARAKASAKVVFSFATRNRFWFGITISVSTCFWSSSMPASATRDRLLPSNWKGLVTTPIARTPCSRARRAITGAAPVPVPPPIPAVTNTMLAPARCPAISSSVSSAAARPISGRDPAPSPCVILWPSWSLRSARDCTSDWASVFATRNSTPVNFASIMLLTAFPPAPPTPTTRILGFVESVSGTERLIVMGVSFLPKRGVPGVAFEPAVLLHGSTGFGCRSWLRCFPSATAPACPADRSAPRFRESRYRSRLDAARRTAGAPPRWRRRAR